MKVYMNEKKTTSKRQPRPTNLHHRNSIITIQLNVDDVKDLTNNDYIKVETS